ncbi:hypothetical protein PTSG_13159 [Salpingoeca rosetta]|uniref:Alpha-galactosidase n=1 Tax=Salpingoeca rosetta (strain ATCC 50818 / BSB-021) TaxID=946362 RepID=F2USV1_SALR5|nr:uncharacterized protein PTSG_13159 [Salpingoeca rosetta]EGD81210.1 hypothetical protein PTSG_13159 [Salpingoeca rosetta]|eukprot:XP_004987744.1 hypothetical protein PTSG_13159 [Salpingoeca rosetta]
MGTRTVAVQAVAMLVCAAAVFGSVTGASDVGCRNKLAQTPPMGWMSWEIFRCQMDCKTYPNSCINADLYKTTADAMKAKGFLDAGYDTVHIDDCWEADARDPNTGRLAANADRFPGGIAPLADYIHKLGLKFGLYTAESKTTCTGHVGSYLNEILDAQTFADWGVDYLKVDGCNPNKTYYPTGYTAMGTALQISGRDIVYSCSWPAYLGSNETTKPYNTMIGIGCNLWRNWHDIQCNWKSLSSIIDHWGDYGQVLASYAGPGHWNDPDMLLIGNDCITDDQARTQMAIWSIVAAPLIMGNDVRNITASTRAILLNRDAIAVNQDPLGQAGFRISPKGATEVWARNITNAVAVALLNKGSQSSSSADSEASRAQTMRLDLPAGNDGQGPVFTHVDRDAQLRARSAAATAANTTTITVNFSDIGVSGSADVYDIWAGKTVGTFSKSYSALVPEGGTAFLRITPKK